MSSYDLSALKPALKAAVKQAIVEDAPNGGAARVGELLIEGGSKAGAGGVKVFGLPVSCNTLGPVLMAMISGAGGLDVLDITQGLHKTDDYAKINPYQQIPGMQDGDFCLGESLAILTYIAKTYAPHFYSVDPKKAARMDQAMQAFKNNVADPHSKVVFPFLGFTGFPEGGFTTEVATLDAALAKWAGHFLPEGNKFVGGDKPCVVDVLVLPFLYSARHEVVKAECSFALSERLATYTADLEATFPAATVAILSEGFSLQSHITDTAAKRKAA